MSARWKLFTHTHTQTFFDTYFVAIAVYVCVCDVPAWDLCVCAKKAPKTNTKCDTTRTNARDGVVVDRLNKTFPLINNFAHFFPRFFFYFSISCFSFSFNFFFVYHLAYYHFKDFNRELKKKYIPNTKQKVIFFYFFLLCCCIPVVHRHNLQRGRKKMILISWQCR